MAFDKDGILTGINGTQYDFNGKAEYIRRLIDNNGTMEYRNPTYTLHYYFEVANY